MKYIMMNIVPIICVIAAAYIVSIGANGWGWFLFVGAITTTSWTTVKQTNTEDYTQ